VIGRQSEIVSQSAIDRQDWSNCPGCCLPMGCTTSHELPDPDQWLDRIDGLSSTPTTPSTAAMTPDSLDGSDCGESQMSRVTEEADTLSAQDAADERV